MLIPLADTGRSTTRVGFGASSIMGGMGRTESLRTLEWAYDAGIRHFDVAPMYGFGAAEGCLGEFLARHAGELTIATKFGIPPAANAGLMGLARSLARSVARPVLKLVPAMKARAQAAAAALAAAPAVRDLSPAAARLSLENSLRALRVDRIDLFLLHDATAAELRDESLLHFLQQARAQGQIGAFGIGTDPHYVAEIMREAPAYAAVVQTEWSVFDAEPAPGNFRISHRSLAHNYRRLLAAVQARADAAQQWSAECNADLLAPDVLATLMMRAALHATRGGIVLFSSKNKDHICHNAQLAAPGAQDAQAAALYRVVQRELAAIPVEAAA